MYPCVGVHGKMSHEFSLLPQQYSACLVHVNSLWDGGGRTVAVLWCAALRICSKQHTSYIYLFKFYFWSYSFYAVEFVNIIIMSRYQHGYPWPSLATPPYHPLLPAGLQSYIPCQHRAAVCRFELVVLPLPVHMKGSTGVHHLWARPYFSSSVLHVWFV